MTVLGVACDETLGGRFFDQVVLDIMADKFNEQLKGDDVRKYARAIGKLRKEAERVKDVLSANQAYQVGEPFPEHPSSCARPRPRVRAALCTGPHTACSLARAAGGRRGGP
eukprot:450761-Prymnesium_polylepis.1